MYGDPKLISFDKMSYDNDTMEVGTYLMAMSAGGAASDSSCKFAVEVGVDFWHNLIGSRMIHAVNVTLRLRNHTIDLRPGTLQINGSNKGFPYESSVVQVSSNSLGALYVNVVGCHMRLVFDRSMVLVFARRDLYSGTLSGMCGNCNSKATDEDPNMLNYLIRN
ncbi:uncharacterized protein LOC141904750 [Tubulanus polymorphus]|uniref:uncharacterized protein LOC141904750 n=1 Tax=Tubulanus polymorphus TaxID=672921 RepID=UPI003DA5B8CD